MFHISAFIGSIATLVPKAYAGGSPAEAITSVAAPIGSGLGSSGSSANFGNLLVIVGSGFIPLVYILAVLIMVISGIMMVVDQSEERFTRSRNAIIGSIVAIILVNLSGVLAQALFGSPTINLISAPTSSASLVQDEVYGLINWIEVPIAVAAVLIIVISGIQTLTSYGTSQGTAALRRTVLSVIVGLLLITSKIALSRAFTTEFKPDGIIERIISIGIAVLGFITLIAVGVIIYAGLMMILNLNNDDRYTRARGILIRVVVGITVILISGALVGLVLAF